ncbi:MAG: T9SS type A sorting domain-containing protein [Bacteroidota bacterium]
MRKTLQFGISVLSLLFISKNIDAQTISNHYFGVNAWMPDTIGNYYTCPEPPCYFNGKLHKNWAQVKSSGTTFVRYGGIGTDKNMPTNFQYLRIIDSIRANGMEPIIQVPFYNNRYTAQQAANIVYYINVVKGRNIKYWIIGNEPNLSYSYTTAAQIAAYFKPFASAMKNVDPTILIIGPETASFKQSILNDLTNPGGPSDITGKDGAGRYYLDVYSFHTYPMGDGTQARAQLIPKLTATGSFQDNLTYLNTRITAANTYHNRTGASALKTAVTETNVNYNNSPTDNIYGVGANSFLGGQFVAEIYGIGLKKGVDFINLWSVIEGGSNVVNNAGFLDGATGNKKPLYHHFKLMADNFKGSNVNCTTNQVNVKSFASKDAQQIAVLILNEDQAINFSYTVGLNTTAIGGTSVLKINSNAGIAKEYTDVIQNQSTTLLLFDMNGNLIKKYEYKLIGNANVNLPPTVTLFSTSAIATITPAGPTTFCADGSVALNANTGVGYTYQWKKDNITISGATGSSYTANVTGSYSVSVTNAGTTTTSAPQIVTASPMPVATITPAGPITFTAGSSVVLNATTATGYVYQWKKDGANITGATSPSYSANQAGSYQLKVTLGSCSKWSSLLAVTVIPSTTATITASGPLTFCEGANVTMNANTGVGYTYQWKKDNIIINGATSSSYSVVTSGSYAVDVTNAGTTTTSAPQIATVLPLPVAIITPGGPTSFTSGDSVVLSANAGSGYIYQWKKEGVNIIGATNSSYTASQAGSYQVKVTSGSCPNWSAPIIVTVLPSTTATITASGPLTFCEGANVTLNANTGVGYTYQWKKDNIIINGATNSSYIAGASGSYAVDLTNAGATTTSAPQIVTVSPLPVAIITPGGPTSFTSGDSVILSANAGSGYIYQWKKEGVNILGATNSSYTASQAGSYQVKVTSGSCPNWSAPIVITVLPPTATITASGPITFCAGNNVTLNANSGTGYTYQWKKDNIIINGATGSSYIAVSSGSYAVDITSAGITTASSALVVTADPVPVAAISAGSSTTFTFGDSVILNAGAGSGYIYQWEKEGVNILGAVNSSYTAYESGNYQIKATLGSCPNWSAPIAITVLPIIPTDTTLITSISNNQNADVEPFGINVFPNPFHMEFNIKLTNENYGGNSFEIEITNLLGQKIYSKNHTFSNGQENIVFPESEPEGIYLLKVISKNKTSTQKIAFSK